MRLNGLLAVNPGSLKERNYCTNSCQPRVITVVLYISEIISMATVDNFDVEELFVKQNSYPKVINVMKIS